MTFKLLVVGTRPEFFAMLDRLKIDRHPDHCPVGRVSTVRQTQEFLVHLPYRVLSTPTVIERSAADSLRQSDRTEIKTDDETLKTLGMYQATLL